MAWLPETIAIPRIVENKTILIDSLNDLLTIEDTSLNRESTSKAAIRIRMVMDENLNRGLILERS